MSDEHPTPKELDGLLDGGLSEEATLRVVRHLLLGCPACRAVVFPRAAEILKPRVQPDPTPEDEAGYDGAIDRAFATVRKLREERLAHSRRP